MDSAWQILHGCQVVNPCSTTERRSRAISPTAANGCHKTSRLHYAASPAPHLGRLVNTSPPHRSSATVRPSAGRTRTLSRVSTAQSTESTFQPNTYWLNQVITCSTVVLQCYRRFLWSKPKFDPPWLCTPWTDRHQTWYLITSATPTLTPVLVKFGWVGNSPQIGEI